VDGERVFIWWTAPEQSWIAALDQKDGRELWKHELGGFESKHGAGSSPIVFEGTVILDFGQEKESGGGQGSYTVCLDAKSGAVKWKTPRPSTSSTASTPCIYRPEGGEPQLILISRTAGMTSLDPRTGKANWELSNLMPRRCVASPVVTPGGLLIAQCGEGQAESLVAAVRPATKDRPPEKAYEVVRTGGYVPTPIAVGDLLFLWKENGLVTCLRAATNEQLWSERVEGPFYGSPVCVNGRLLNMTRRGELVILAAADKFQPIARIALGEGSYATPAVAEGALFLRTFTQLIKVGK
jgi:outer membrane protein assembly factor BamB